jgi:hypothetical protein
VDDVSSPSTLTPEQRRRFARQTVALAAEETDDEGSAEWRAEMIGAIDRRRSTAGIPPLAPWWSGKGEPKLHERARALGLLRPLR